MNPTDDKQPENNPAPDKQNPLEPPDNVAQQQYQYSGPVAQTNFQKAEYSASYNSANQPVHKTNARRRQILALAVILLLIAGVVAFALLKSDSEELCCGPYGSDRQTQRQAAGSDESEATEDVTAEGDEQADAPTEEAETPVEETAPPEASDDPASGDSARRDDINNLYAALEVFFNENAYYPSDFSMLSGLDPEVLKDPSGNEIKIDIPRLSSQQPMSPYSVSEPAGAQYTYSPYNCGPGASGEAKCNKYALFSWQATDPDGYNKLSLN